MALRAGYKGFKKVINGLKVFRPGVLGLDLGVGLAIDTDGKLKVTGDLEDYAPNIKANTQLIADTVGWSGKNRIIFPYLYKPSFPYESDGVRYTLEDGDEKGVITVNRISGTSNSTFVLNTRITPTNLPLEAGNYVGNGGYDSSVLVRFFCTRNGESVVYGDSIGGDVPFTVLEGDIVGVMIFVSTNASPSNVKIKPMIRKANILDSTYEPYHESVEDVLDTIDDTISDHKTTINAIISAATGATDFAAFKTAMEALTPLTRSIPSGSDQRSLQDITPEDVPEEVEVKEEVEEKPVTRKTTKKSTVKEGE